jgi:hypothetical protein
VNQPPFVLAGHRIFVAAAQKPYVARSLQVVQILRISAVLAVEELNGALILAAAVYQHLLFLALRFESDARNFHVQADRDGGRHHEHEEHREPGLAVFFHLTARFIRSSPLQAATFAACCRL